MIPDAAHDCTSGDAKVRAAGLAHLKWAIDCLEAAGGEVLCGPFYQPLGVFSGEPPTPDERSRREVHKQAAKYAARANIKLSVEPLNRFECYALNTVADAAEIARRVDEPNYGLLYDTFHANIEEKHPVGVIAPNLRAINHVHFVRERPRYARQRPCSLGGDLEGAKGQSGYDGWCVSKPLVGRFPDLAAATRVWRDFFPIRDEVYQFGGKFLREEWAKA